MTVPRSPSRSIQPAGAWRRWAVVLTLSILLHVLLLGWGSNSLHWPAPHAPTQRMLNAALLAPAPIPQSAPPAKPAPKKAPAHPHPAAKPAAKPVPPPQAAAEATSEPAPPPAAADARDSAYSVPTEPLPSWPVADIGTGHGADGTAASPAAASPAPATPAAAASAADPHYQFSPPPSADLRYDVEAWREGQRVYGHGSIVWHTDGNRYRIDGDAGVLIFSVLSFTSEGTIDDSGVAPVLYHEKRFRKSATNTHFQRERNRISFSASTASYPRQGGEQDRASVIWQLASIGRGDGSRFAAGADIDLFVAGVRDAETWRMHILGQEAIELDGQRMPAWHVVRVPRPGSYDQTIDIWLAPGREWYPVKLRYTETSGDYLDLLLSDIKPPPASDQAAPTAAADPAASHEWTN